MGSKKNGGRMLVRRRKGWVEYGLSHDELIHRMGGFGFSLPARLFNRISAQALAQLTDAVLAALRRRLEN